MSDRSNPGPPLIAGEEHCPCQAPSAIEYVRASAVALLSVALGAGIWLLLTLLLQRIAGLSAVLVGATAGAAIHWAAGRHRSIPLGVVAVTTVLLANLGGFALLWLPMLGRLPFPRQLGWYHLLTLGIAALIAYSLNAPKGRGTWVP